MIDNSISSVKSFSSVTMLGTSRASLNFSPDYKQWAKPESPPRTAKRKRNDGMDYDLEAVAISSGKRKKAKTSKVHWSNEGKNLDLVQGLNLTIAKLDSRLLADYVAKRTKWFSPNLSLVELEEMYISGIFDDIPRPVVAVVQD